MMNNYWTLKTKGDPLGTVNSFFRTIWNVIGLQGLILPSTRKNGLMVIDNVSDLQEVNPFQPLMIMNIAGLVPKFLENNPDGYYGILLRPCELRAMNEVEKRLQQDTTRLVKLCVDCLGTYPDDEFEWRAARKESDGEITREVLQFAPQGGIAAYRFRAACQMCKDPGARYGDINIGILGIPVRQAMLVNGRQDLLNWERNTDGPSNPILVEKRDTLLAKMIERHTETRNRVLTGLVDVLPDDVDKLLDHFEECGDCNDCMNVCPICQTDAPHKNDSGRYVKQDVMNWLVDCAGCGMCEQSCPRHMPLSIIFTHIKKSLEESLVV